MTLAPSVPWYTTGNTAEHNHRAVLLDLRPEVIVSGVKEHLSDAQPNIWSLIDVALNANYRTAL